jgi:rare lipoprotein A
MKDMKSFVLSLVLLLAIGVAGSVPASAAISDDARETARRDRAASYQDTGTHLQRQRVARASINDSDDDDWGYRSSRRHYSSEKYAEKRRYAKRSSVRTAKNGKRKHYAQRKAKKHYAQRSKKHYANRGTPRKVATPRPRNIDPITSVLQGLASFYWEPQRVAAGGWFNPNAMTAAHKSLPFGTKVRVTHLGNGKSVDVKINDRGPYVAGRIIDLSKAAASVLGMQGQGVAKVKVTVLGRE